MAWYLLNKAKKRKINIFLSSLLGALGLWVLFSLSKPVTYNSQISIELIDIPQELSSPLRPSNTFTIQVKSTGWSYLFAKWGKNKPLISLGVANRIKGGNFILSDHLKDISKQLGKNMEVLAISPKSINLKRSKIVTKTVPLRLRHQLSFDQFYGQSGPIKLQPKFVNISGKAEDLQNIEEVFTEVLQLTQLNTDAKQWLGIEETNQEKISLSPQKVFVSLPVSRFTEKELRLPIMVHNNTKNRTLVLLPNQVKLTLSVALNHYEHTRAANFEAYIDLAGKDLKEIRTLPIKLKKVPNFVRIIRFEPQSVDLMMYQ